MFTLKINIKERSMGKKKLLILGAGQYGYVARETAEAMGCFYKIGFLDDNSPLALGSLADYEMLRQEYSCSFVAIGNSELRMQWLDKLEQAEYELPVLVHPKAHVSPSAKLGKGTIVEAMAVVNTEAVVEAGGLICAGCVVNHNAHIMSACQIDCNAVVASNAVVPAGTKVSSGTVYQEK